MPWSTDDLKRLVDVEAQLQGVDPQLARAVVSQESEWNPNAVGDNGRSIGLFQLQEAAAKDAGLHPRFRGDVPSNVTAGITYLKQKLTQSGGNVEQALSRYNRGTPDYRGIGDPNYVQNVLKHYPDYQPPAAQKPGMLARVGQALSPGSAEASTPSRLEEIEAELARRDTQQPPQATTPTTQPQAPASPHVAPTGTQTPPAPSPDPSPTPGMRFQALPSITQLDPADRIQKTRDFERLQPELQEEFLRSEEPSAGGLAVAGGPVAQSQPVTDPAAALAMGRRAAGWREGDPLPPGARRPPTPTEAPLEEGITAPSTMIPLLMPGAGITAVTPLLGKAGPLITRGARAAAEGLSQTAGWTAGRTAETGEVPSPGEIGKEAALNVGTGGALEIPGALLRKPTNALLRSTPGAQTLLNQQAVKEAEGLGTRVFNAQDSAVVKKAFATVAATGEKLDTSPVRTLWHSLTPAEQRIAGSELSKISSTFADALKTKKLGDWDIGDLQHLQSELRKASLVKRTPETIDLLHSMRSSVQEAIHNGMTKGSLPAAELITAQKAYRKVMQADDLQALVTRHTKDGPNLKWQELNLAALNKEIRGGGRKKVQELVKGMDVTEREALQQELASLSRKYPFVRAVSTVGNLASAGSLIYGTTQLLSGNVMGAVGSLLPTIANAAVRSPRIMSAFKSSIIEGKGRLSSHQIDALINAIRHENEGETPAQ